MTETEIDNQKIKLKLTNRKMTTKEKHSVKYVNTYHNTRISKKTQKIVNPGPQQY